MRWHCLGFIIAMLTAVPALAQQVTLQQPAIGTFSVNTSVSVPDGGRMLLGGVSNGAASRITTGPLRSGTSYGSQFSGSSVSVGVHIHDLRAMDEALLASAPSPVPVNAWEKRLAERRGTVSASTVAATSKDSPAARAASFETLAARAEERGKTAVAQIYWRLAAKEGSTIASAKLAELDRPSTATATVKK